MTEVDVSLPSSLSVCLSLAPLPAVSLARSASLNKLDASSRMHLLTSSRYTKHFLVPMSLSTAPYNSLFRWNVSC